MGGEDLAAENDAQPARFRAVEQGRRRRAARIDDRGHFGARIGGVESRRPRGVVIGEKRHAPARRDAEAIDIGLDGRGQHHAGPVVAAEDDGPVERAGGEHGALRHDAPHDLARREGRRLGQMIADPFDGAVTIVIDAENRRAKHQAHIGQAAQFGHRLVDESDGRGVVDWRLFARAGGRRTRNPLPPE